MNRLDRLRLIRLTWRTAALAFLVGFLLTIAVAWGAFGITSFYSGVRGNEYFSQSTWAEAVPQEWPAAGWNEWRRGFGVLWSTHSAKRAATSFAAQPPKDKTHVYQLDVWRCGWPRPALRHSHGTVEVISRFAFGAPSSSGSPSAVTELWTDSWMRGVPLDAVGLTNRRLPIRPVWTGFFIDWLFWSFIFLTTVIAWRALRTRRRRRTSRCVWCAYHIDGSPTRCPECGRDPLSRFGRVQ